MCQLLAVTTGFKMSFHSLIIRDWAFVRGGDGDRSLSLSFSNTSFIEVL